MYVPCDCGNQTFHIRFEFPLRCFAVCTECENEKELGGGNR